MEPWAWSIVLLLSGIAIVVAEVFVPSGVVLGVLAVLCFVAGIGVAFLDGMKTGFIMLGVTSLAIPLVTAIAIQWWPHTPIGKRILIPRPESPDDVLPDTPDYRLLKSLVGQRGRSTCKMLPGGTVMIGQQTYEAMSLGMPIEQNTAVEVVEVRMNRLVVRPCEESSNQAAAELRNSPPSDDIPSDDMLSRPFDSLGIEDPLA
jgi:membrane-bound serine protease (ClpP class)